MVLLDGDVPGFGPGAFNLVLLFNHDSCEPSSFGRVTKNVPDVVVAKNKGRTVVTTNRMVAKHIQFGTADHAVAAQSWTHRRQVKRNTEKDLRLKAKTNLELEAHAANRWHVALN